MAAGPFISICIPCLKRAHLLRRLLDSIVIQTYKDFNIIITDNSDDTSVLEVVGEYQERLPINYHKNDTLLEMGANWNACMQRANGTWLKLMHDDDWFSDEHCLAAFADEAGKHETGLIFSAFYNVVESSGTSQLVLRKAVDLMLLKFSPYNLLRGNFIGPPSVTLIHRSTFIEFHPNLKWIVDMEEYLRVLKQRPGLFYINAPLICIGVHEGQATEAYFRNASIEIKENCIMLMQHYPRFCRNIFAYDHCWRLIRNLNIAKSDRLALYSDGNVVPPCFYSILRFQRLLPRQVVQFGFSSKILMFLHWSYFNVHLLSTSLRS